MATFKRFEEIDAWQSARALTNTIYGFTFKESFSRDFALRDQIRRAGISVGSNIAEGFGRNSNREFRNFLGYASGSTHEVQSQLYTALDQKYIIQEEFDSAYHGAERTKMLIGGLIHYLDKSRI